MAVKQIFEVRDLSHLDVIKVFSGEPDSLDRKVLMSIPDNFFIAKAKPADLNPALPFIAQLKVISFMDQANPEELEVGFTLYLGESADGRFELTGTYRYMDDTGYIHEWLLDGYEYDADDIARVVDLSEYKKDHLPYSILALEDYMLKAYIELYSKHLCRLPISWC